MQAFEIDIDQIKSLLNDEAQILKIKSPYDEKTAEQIKYKITSSMAMGYYSNAPRIGRIGMAFFESIQSPEKRDFYYKNTEKWNRELQQSCFPFLSPIDYIKSQLDLAWPSGAKLASFDGQKMFSGLARIFKEGASAEPHQDIFLRDAPELGHKLKIKEQIAFNIYLDMPEEGGEIELWNWKAKDSDFENLRNSNPSLSYAFDRNKIPSCDITYKPKKGDILLFNPRHVHAVTACFGKPRLTISTFIGYTGDDDPLVLWS